LLVDEYQDTSGTQNRLVELLINYWDKPNVFVVGDDDQSIYRFQGANVENMLAFADNYKNDLLTVVLTNNYRSTQPILDVSKSLIDRNNERLVKQIDGLSKALLSSNVKLNQLIHTPIIKEYESPRHEMIDITLQVEKLLQQGTQPGRIGIIYKRISMAKNWRNILNYAIHQCLVNAVLNILDIPLAQKIVLLVRYLAAEHDTPYGGDEMLFELLHFDWFHIPPIEIAKLTMEVADKQFSENKTSIRRLLFEKSNTPPKDLFSQGIHPQLKKASSIIEKLIADVPNVTLQVLFERIIREAGVLQSLCKVRIRSGCCRCSRGFFDFVKEETHRRPTMHLQELVSIIELMEKEGLSTPLVQVSGMIKA
jgi:DNA helicase-2/ATP-dependent DNA helicase PcrA